MLSYRASCELAASIGCALLLLAGASGCSDGMPPAHPTSGSVLVDGQPVEGVELIFYPLTPFPSELPVPTPRAVTDGAGRFEVSTYTGRDGAPAGDYRVALVRVQPIPDGADPESFQQDDLLAGRYADPKTSGVTATISAGSNELPTINLVANP